MMTRIAIALSLLVGAIPIVSFFMGAWWLLCWQPYLP
jgi:hypothetical protein